MVWHFGQTSAEQWFHNDNGDAALLEFFVEVLARASLVFLIVPVNIVCLNLHEVPVIFVVMCQSPVEDSHIPMEGEAEVADASCLTLLHEPVKEAVVEVALMYWSHATAADAVQ